MLVHCHFVTYIGHALDKQEVGDQMARKVKDKELDSSEARRKLKTRGKPYYRSIERGLHLGYRKLKGAAGTWLVRHYLGKQAYEVERIGTADDLSDADGVVILDYWQAQDKARERMVSRAHATAGKSGHRTVANVMDAYLEYLETNSKSVVTTRYRAKAFIYPALGAIEVEKLTTDQLRNWQAGIVKMAPRWRGIDRGHFKGDEDALRRRKASANRIFTMLRAALNHAFNDGKVSSDKAWRKVKPFKGVDTARVLYLKIAECQRLINACDPDFRKLVQAALLTGARYSELGRLEVVDFNADVGTIAVRRSKPGKSRHVVLTDEGDTFFAGLCAGRAGGEIMLRKADGGVWGASHQAVRIVEACKRAKIDPPISFHVLRHTYASLAIMNGVPLLVIAKNLGHKDTRMVEKHYGHLAPSFVADAIRAGAPKFGIEPEQGVASLDERRTRDSGR
jgi:integrase